MTITVGKIEKAVNKLNLIYKLYAIVGDEPFWFEDVKDITSPQMLSELNRIRVLKQTGIVKESFICIDDYNNLYKKVTIKQWQFEGNPYETKRVPVDELNQMCAHLRAKEHALNAYAEECHMLRQQIEQKLDELI